MQLYRWNPQLAQAVLHDAALFEVAIRNAYDRCITQSFAMTLAPVGDDLEDLLKAIGVIR